jgi:hypothetical protein
MVRSESCPTGSGIIAALAEVARPKASAAPIAIDFSMVIFLSKN